MRAFYCLVVLSILLSGCDRYYRTETGLLYKIVVKGKDSLARIANTAKIHYIQKAGDSIVESTYNKMPLYYKVMPWVRNRYNPLEVFDYGIHGGDSFIVIQRLDSMIKKGILDELPSYLKMDDRWVSYLKVEEVFRSDSLLQLDKIHEKKRVDSIQKILGRQRVEKYIVENKIKCLPTEGVYVELFNEGEGPRALDGKRVEIKYSFSTLAGKVFDGNVDRSFNRPDTLKFITGKDPMLKGVESGLKMLRPGGHAKIYIPTVMAFGGQPPSQSKLKPYEDVVLDVKLLKVSDQPDSASVVHSPYRSNGNKLPKR